MAVTIESVLSSHGVEPEDILHHGVLGMKWGKHLPGKGPNSPHPDYSANQRVRDQEIYGRRGVNRINRSLHAGNSIATARSIEKTRRDTILGNQTKARRIGATVGAGVGVAGGVAANIGVHALRSHAVRQAGAVWLAKRFGYDTAKKVFTTADNVATLLDSPAGKKAMVAGGAYLGLVLGDVAGKTINTRIIGGYNPNRKR